MPVRARYGLLRSVCRPLFRGFGPPAPHNSGPFLDDQFLISLLAGNLIDAARGPADGDGIDPGGRPQAEMDPGVAGRLETAVGPYLGALLHGAGRHFHPGPEAVAIGLFTHRLDAQPVSLPGRLITQ